MDRWDQKYKAIACELVEQLSKHGLTMKEACFVLDFTKASYNQAANATVLDPALIRKKCLQS